MSIHFVKSNDIDGQVIDQQLTVNKISYSGTEVMVRTIDSKGNLISTSKQDKFNRIQQKVFDANNNPTKVKNAETKDDNGQKVFENAHVERTESDIQSSNFVYTSPTGHTESSSIKDNAKSINSGSEFMTGESSKKPIDEIQFEGNNAAIMKKEYTPLLSQSTKAKENKLNVPKKGMTGLRLINYDIKKK